jgi:hypothetical protein
MIQWQFLIQKEGDQDWLPLESPNVEILEGRYYLMAQSDHQSMPVEIQIRHEYELEGIPQAVMQRRRQQTDAQGLLELFSLTYLPPGLWELQCQVASDHEDKKAPAQKLVLQVLAQDFEVLSDWAYPEPSFGEDVPIKASVDFSGLPVATAYSSTKAVAPAAQLPAIPKEAAPLLLRLSDPFCLPPILYRPQKDRDETVVQLPDFVLNNPLMPAMPLAMMELPLHLLHCVTESADRQEVYKAFEPLARRQRFLRTLNTLVQRS